MGKYPQLYVYVSPRSVFPLDNVKHGLQRRYLVNVPERRPSETSCFSNGKRGGLSKKFGKKGSGTNYDDGGKGSRGPYYTIYLDGRATGHNVKQYTQEVTDDYYN